MKRILAASLVFSSIALSVIALSVGGSVTTRPNASPDAFNQAQNVDTSTAIVQLKGDPLSIHSATKPAPGKKIDFNSNTLRSVRAQLAAGRNEFRRWLRANAPRIRITSEYDISLNAVAVELNGTPLETIAAAPMVQQVHYNALYHPNLSQSYQIINASAAWTAAGGRAMAGAGIKIGNIDSGIDETHPFFDPTGFSYPPGFPKCDAADSNSHTPDQDCKYVSPKVIVAKVFYNKANQQGLDAQAIDDHGTHTAGIAAGVTGKTAVVDGVSIGDMSGMAPGAWLGNYNVFPAHLENERSEDVLNAVDAAIADGMDVLNLSLGGTHNGNSGNNDLLAMALDNTVDAGLVVAVAAGNSGPGPDTIWSPGRARKVITVGASTNQHFVGQPFTYPAGGGTTIGAFVGGFPALPTASYDLFDTHSTSCSSVDPGASGKLAIVDSGACTFSTQVRNAIAVGAVGVLFIFNNALDPGPPAKDGQGGDNLPAVLIGGNEGAALRASGATTASADDTRQEFITPNKDILLGLSSQGPTTVDLAIKPDLTSVGVLVLSSITCVGKPNTCPGDGTGWAFFTGTSMATPHIAGAAAVLLDLHSTWSPAQVKSALVNHADLVIKDTHTALHDIGPTAQGAGRENLSVAADATTWLDPVSASFGKVTIGHPTSLTITLSNPTGTDETFTVSKTKFTPSTFGGTVPSVFDAGTLSSGDDRIVVPASVTVPANGSTSLTVTVNADHGDVVQGWINLDGPGSNDLHLAYYAVVGL